MEESEWISKKSEWRSEESEIERERMEIGREEVDIAREKRKKRPKKKLQLFDALLIGKYFIEVDRFWKY